uniref:Uncharacterized protein n=1 Tax=Kalanchoe fedtschenkoi TaxID=63787 RepID=A0A7N0U8D2_KALFE
MVVINRSKRRLSLCRQPPSLSILPIHPSVVLPLCCSAFSFSHAPQQIAIALRFKVRHSPIAGSSASCSCFQSLYSLRSRCLERERLWRCLKRERPWDV